MLDDTCFTMVMAAVGQQPASSRHEDQNSNERACWTLRLLSSCTALAFAPLHVHLAAKRPPRKPPSSENGKSTKTSDWLRASALCSDGQSALGLHCKRALQRHQADAYSSSSFEIKRRLENPMTPLFLSLSLPLFSTFQKIHQRYFKEIALRPVYPHKMRVFIMPKIFHLPYQQNTTRSCLKMELKYNFLFYSIY